MKVAFVSIFPPNTNGIGDYTHDVCRAVRARSPDTSLLVLADRAGEQAGLDVEVDRCWSLRGNWVPDLLAAAERARPDVVHVQHGYYMGRDGRVPALLEGLKRRGIGTVITLHAVYPQRHRTLVSLTRWSPPRFHRALGATADRIVIHQHVGAFDPLVAHGVDARRIAIIPHGTPEVTPEDPRAARERLGLPLDRPIALFLGFISATKGVDTVVRAFRQVARDVPSALLVIAGRPEPTIPDPQYRVILEWLMRRGRREGWIEYRPGYLPAADIPAYLASADVVVFPYRQKYGSASGILHRAFAAGRAIVCSRGPKFSDAAAAMGEDASIVFPASGDVRHWSRSLTRLLGDAAARARVEQITAELGRQSAWPTVADKHLALYRDIVAERPTPAAHGG